MGVTRLLLSRLPIIGRLDRGRDPAIQWLSYLAAQLIQVSNSGSLPKLVGRLEPRTQTVFRSLGEGLGDRLRVTDLDRFMADRCW